MSLRHHTMCSRLHFGCTDRVQSRPQDGASSPSARVQIRDRRCSPHTSTTGHHFCVRRDVMNPNEIVPEFIREALGEPPTSGEERALEHALVSMAETVGIEPPRRALRDRLLAAATTGPMRYAPFFDQLRRL